MFRNIFYCRKNDNNGSDDDDDDELHELIIGDVVFVQVFQIKEMKI